MSTVSVATTKPVHSASFPPERNSGADILNSWKEIARYLDRGIRTVQRWEEQLALPVRRPHGRGRSAVFAVKSELDAWLRSCPATSEKKSERVIATRMALGITHGLVEEAHQLRSNLVESRTQLDKSVSRLITTLGRMLTPDNDSPGRS